MPKAKHGKRKTSKKTKRNKRFKRSIKRGNVRVLKVRRTYYWYNFNSNGASTGTSEYWQWSLNGGTVNGSTAVMSSVPDLPHYQALYDTVRVKKLKFKFSHPANYTNISQAVEPPPAANPSYQLPTILTAIDYDQPAMPIAAGKIYEYQTMRRTRGPRDHNATLYPKLQVPVTSTPGQYILQTGSKQWTNLQSPLNYNGLLVYMDSPTNLALGGGVPYNVQVWVTVDLEFKNQV